MTIDRFQDHPAWGFIDWALRGIGQVVFQNNPLSGLVILAAIFYNSWVYGVVIVIGVVTGTATACLLQADRHLVRNGLFGFNSALVGVALVAFTSQDFRSGSFPSGHMLVYIVCAAALAAIAFSSISALLGPHRVAALTMPFNLVGWLFLFAVLKFSSIDAGPLTKPVSPDQYAMVTHYLLPTWYMGIGNAIGQIFFQDNWIAGYLILIAIAINSRTSALMALLGAVLAEIVAMSFGAPEGAIRDGLYGYNAALTGMAIGGFFLVLTLRSFFYAVFGIVVSTWLWASVAIFLEPIGMPVFTSTFVIVTWAMLIGQHGFKALVPVAPADATTAEDNRRRYLAARRGS